ncbi:MAG TPA: hypothetical protein VGP42_11860 [Stellaceae bacterium]|jgi:hypothetical protein|nr:hypothetical protein [Stellaceae bacterium]
MDLPPATPPLPAEYYRRHAARVRQLASDATTTAVKEHLREVALEYERLAERVDSRPPVTEP